jgi:hypothetical protein
MSAQRSAAAATTARLRSAGCLAVCLAIASALGGCAYQPPAPWERGLLARPDMAVQPDPLQARMQESVYASKENAAGGGGIGGGGCGCN